MTSWTIEDVLVSFLYVRSENRATLAQVTKSLPELKGAEAALEGLAEAQFVERAGDTFSLTAKGKSRVPTVTRRRPKKEAPKWLRDRLLPSLEVGREAALTKAEIDGILVARAAGKSNLTPAQAKAALLWHLLGRDSTESFDEANVKRFLLGRHLKRDIRSLKAAFAWIAAGEAESTQADVRPALRSRFLASLERTPKPPGGVPRESRPTFAERALAAAARSSKRFGEDHVFVLGAFEALGDPSMSLECFKERLLESFGSRELKLSRADLTAAMDREMVQASEIRGVAGSTFHFIVLGDHP